MGSRVIVWKILPVIVVVMIAGISSFLLSQEFPLGFTLATIFPLLQGHLPPTIFGHGKMVGTPEVPDDLMPQPRPQNEMFLDLPGEGGKFPQQGIGMCCRATATDDFLVYRNVLWYLLLGGRHIDGAHIY